MKKTDREIIEDILKITSKVNNDLQSFKQDVTKDTRGWPKEKSRKLNLKLIRNRKKNYFKSDNLSFVI